MTIVDFLTQSVELKFPTLLTFQAGAHLGVATARLVVVVLLTDLYIIP